MAIDIWCVQSIIIITIYNSAIIHMWRTYTNIQYTKV